MRHRLLSAAFILLAVSCTDRSFTVYTTTEDNPWAEASSFDKTLPGNEADLVVDLSATGQEVQGFGVCFSELSHRALSKLSPADYDKVMTDLFAPDGGMGFTNGRMPIGSSDFALKYYSFDDTPGDLAMEHFSVDNDKQALIPLIKSALEKNPDLKVWGSPWCPPQWMKVNGHYASRPLRARMAGPMPGRRRLPRNSRK